MFLSWVQIFVQLTEKDMEGKEEETEDASVPRPSIHSVSSHTSVETPPNGTPTDGDTPVEEESVFDEQGLLFGDGRWSLFETFLHVVYSLFIMTSYSVGEESLLVHYQ